MYDKTYGAEAPKSSAAKLKRINLYRDHIKRVSAEEAKAVKVTKEQQFELVTSLLALPPDQHASISTGPATPDSLARIQQERGVLAKQFGTGVSQMPADASVVAVSLAAAAQLQRIIGGGKIAAGIVVADSGRAFYVGGDTAVALSPTDSADVFVHEMGHLLEHNLPGARLASQQFLQHRVADEKPRPMNEVVPGRNYRPGEEGRKNHFDRAFKSSEAYYVGKVYENGSTEVLSMGVQQLMNNPAKFHADDPEYFKFVVGVLRGELR